MRDKLKSLPKLRYSKFNKAIVFFGLALLALLAILFIHWNGTFLLPPVIANITRGITIIIGAYFAASLIIRLTITKIAHFFGESVQIEQKILLTKAYTGIIYAVATVVVLAMLGATLENLTLFVGLVATAIAFALRDILMSYLAWYILLTKQPFRIGDYIRIGDEQGIVQHIGTFYVLIDDSPERYEDYVRIPNKTFLEKPIANYGKNLIPEVLRVKIESFPRDYEKKITRLQKYISSIQDLNAQIYLDMVDNKPHVAIKYYIAFSQRRALKDKVLRALLEEFGIEKSK